MCQVCVRVGTQRLLWAMYMYAPQIWQNTCNSAKDKQTSSQICTQAITIHNRGSRTDLRTDREKKTDPQRKPAPRAALFSLFTDTLASFKVRRSTAAFKASKSAPLIGNMPADNSWMTSQPGADVDHRGRLRLSFSAAVHTIIGGIKCLKCSWLTSNLSCLFSLTTAIRKRLLARLHRC